MKHHTPEEKAALIEQVCEFYESQNATIESCCHAAGISENTFRLWLAQNGEFAERYKKAKEAQDKAYWQEIIRPLAKTAMQRHLEVEYASEYSEVVYQGVKVKDEFGQPVLQNSVKAILPNPTTLIFAMKGLYPKMFADRHEHSGPDGGPVEFTVTPASRAKIEALLNEINGIDTEQG